MVMQERECPWEEIVCKNQYQYQQQHIWRSAFSIARGGIATAHCEECSLMHPFGAALDRGVYED